MGLFKKSSKSLFHFDVDLVKGDNDKYYYKAVLYSNNKKDSITSFVERVPFLKHYEGNTLDCAKDAFYMMDCVASPLNSAELKNHSVERPLARLLFTSEFKTCKDICKYLKVFDLNSFSDSVIYNSDLKSEKPLWNNVFSASELKSLNNKLKRENFVSIADEARDEYKAIIEDNGREADAEFGIKRPLKKVSKKRSSLSLC